MLTFTSLTQSEFTDFSQQFSGNNYLQTKEMAELKKNRNQMVDYIGVKDNQKIIGATLITKLKIKMGYYFDIDGGMLMDYSSAEVFHCFIEGIEEYVRKNDGLYVTISPDIPVCVRYDEEITNLNESVVEKFLSAGFIKKQAQQQLDNQGNPLWVYKKNVQGLTEQTLVDSYQKSAQYSIKRAHEFGIQTRKLAYEELQEFKKITEETSQRRQFEDKSLEYYQSVYKSYQEQARFMIAEINIKAYLENLKNKQVEIQKKLETIEEVLSKNPDSRKKNNQKKELLSELATYNKRRQEAEKIAREEKKELIPLACALFMICSQEVVYLFSGTLEKYKQFYAPYLIQDEMLHYTVNRQIPQYNFYGISGNFDGSDGVLKFKESFNGYAEKKIGTFQLITKPTKYRLYQLLKKIKGT
ncbi:aminoacyltransferase [Melissococcus plutonius]|nr:aminoacyltransferase [Melissococcus plutonius]MCV2505715.1 aminoacyltransferase [Melissococcus plutonius]